ncbi:hypothetical protein PCE1_004921 [Barthelona sp. PCE]
MSKSLFRACAEHPLVNLDVTGVGKVFSSLVQFIESNTSLHIGVKLGRFGTICFEKITSDVGFATKEDFIPRFQFNSSFLSTHGLRAPKKRITGRVVDVNYSVISHRAGVGSSVCSDVLTTIFNVFGQHAATGASVGLMIKGIVKLSFSNRVAKVGFAPALKNHRPREALHSSIKGYHVSKLPNGTRLRETFKINEPNTRPKSKSSRRTKVQSPPNPKPTMKPKVTIKDEAPLRYVDPVIRDDIVDHDDLAVLGVKTGTAKSRRPEDFPVEDVCKICKERARSSRNKKEKIVKERQEDAMYSEEVLLNAKRYEEEERLKQAKIRDEARRLQEANIKLANVRHSRTVTPRRLDDKYDGMYVFDRRPPTPEVAPTEMYKNEYERLQESKANRKQRLEETLAAEREERMRIEEDLKREQEDWAKELRKRQSAQRSALEKQLQEKRERGDGVIVGFSINPDEWAITKDDGSKADVERRRKEAKSIADEMRYMRDEAERKKKADRAREIEESLKELEEDTRIANEIKQREKEKQDQMRANLRRALDYQVRHPAKQMPKGCDIDPDAVFLLKDEGVDRDARLREEAQRINEELRKQKEEIEMIRLTEKERVLKEEREERIRIEQELAEERERLIQKRKAEQEQFKRTLDTQSADVKRLKEKEKEYYKAECGEISFHDGLVEQMCKCKICGNALPEGLSICTSHH